MVVSRYKQIVDALAADIRENRIPPGTRLPTHRKLARSHRLALATASRVYAELEAMGLVVGEIGRGTFVRDQSFPRAIGLDLRSAAHATFALSFNEPVMAAQTELLRSALRSLSAAGDLEAILHYLPYGGRLHERTIVARHLRRRDLKVFPSQVMIVNGAQHGLAVTAMGLL